MYTWVWPTCVPTLLRLLHHLNHQDASTATQLDFELKVHVFVNKIIRSNSSIESGEVSRFRDALFDLKLKVLMAVDGCSSHHKLHMPCPLDICQALVADVWRVPSLLYWWIRDPLTVSLRSLHFILLRNK